MKRLLRLLKPYIIARWARELVSIRRGFEAFDEWPSFAQVDYPESSNPLRLFFESRSEGNGIWKWEHYFDAYHRHLRKFCGTEVHVLEIGVYSGGSLEMWRDYFGPRAHIYGVDIEKACQAYKSDRIDIFIGDQKDRNFWTAFRKDVPHLDVVIDDGGHLPEQQITSLEELLPHLRAGGVYLCEDIHGAFNEFSLYTSGLAQKLNDFENIVKNEFDNARRLVCKTTSFQAAVGSIHLYPFLNVFERTAKPVFELIAPKRGTLWQPHTR